MIQHGKSMRAVEKRCAVVRRIFGVSVDSKLLFDVRVLDKPGYSAWRSNGFVLLSRFCGFNFGWGHGPVIPLSFGAKLFLYLLFGLVIWVGFWFVEFARSFGLWRFLLCTSSSAANGLLQPRAKAVGP